MFPPRLGMYMSTFFGFLILALRQTWEYHHDAEGANIKFVLMINCIKIHMLSTQLYDRDKIQRKQDQLMTERERKCAQVGDLNFFGWMNYMLFSPTCFSGPAVEYT